MKTYPIYLIDRRIYKGFMDKKYPITLFIKEIEDDGSSIIVYGYLKNNHFSIKEGEKAEIEADWVEKKKIIGSYKNIKSTKVLSFELSLY